MRSLCIFAVNERAARMYHCLTTSKLATMGLNSL